MRAVRGVFEEGVLGASVEFVPVESAPNKAGGYHYAKAILTGWALTSNPANPQCVRMVKSLGLCLDGDADLGAVDERLVLDTLRGVVEEAVRCEVRAASRALTPPGAHIPGTEDLDLDAVFADPDELSAADVRAALAAVVGASVASGVRSAVNRALGRVD